jgi:hypothetical protein
MLQNSTLAPMRSRGMTEDQAEEVAMKYFKRVRIPEQANKSASEGASTSMPASPVCSNSRMNSSVVISAVNCMGRRKVSKDISLETRRKFKILSLLLRF